MKPWALFLLAAGLPAQQPGSSIYPEMTWLPGGVYQMGDHAGFVDPQHPSDEIPVHPVRLDAFYIGTYDVTNHQYLEFLNAAWTQGLIEVRSGLVYRKGSSDLYCDTRQSADFSSLNWTGSAFTLADNRSTHPVVGIRWAGAVAYANWLSSRLGLSPACDTTTWKCDFTRNGYRLPTEAEWEYAARGGQYNPYYVYPWGNDAAADKANWPILPANPYQTGAYPWTTPVGFFNGQIHTRAEFGWPSSLTSWQSASGANAWGLHDMAGNVWQWVYDWYQSDYYSRSPSDNPHGPDTGTVMPDGLQWHGMRGGNWYNGDQSDPGHARVSNRDPGYFRGPQDPNHPYYHVGFRVAAPVATPLVSRVANAASQTLVVAPNTWVELDGANLAPAGVVRSWLEADFVQGRMPTSLDGVSVSVNGKAAFISYISASQINFLTPPDILPGTATVQVTVNGITSNAFTTQVLAHSPSLFLFQGGPNVAATHSDGRLAGPVTLYPGASTPARPGETVVLYGNGFGATSVPVVSGAATQSGILTPIPVVRIGGLASAVSFAGLVSPGLYQFNVVVPATLADGDQSLEINAGGLSTPAGIVLAVRR